MPVSLSDSILNSNDIRLFCFLDADVFPLSTQPGAASNVAIAESPIPGGSIEMIKHQTSELILEIEPMTSLVHLDYSGG